MNPELIAEIVAKNATDLETIVSVIGIANLLKLYPNFAAIIATLQAAQATPK